MNQTEPIPWRGFSVIDKLIIIALALLAIFSASIIFLDEVFLRRLARQTGMRSLITWLLNDYGSWIISIGFVALLVGFLFWKRYRITSNKQLWYGSGCPECKDRQLIRVSRKRSDRLYSLLGFPVYRYACRNCTWRGLRVARREHSPELDLALEEALLRFDPDDYRLRSQDANPADNPSTLPLLNHDAVIDANGDVAGDVTAAANTWDDPAGVDPDLVETGDTNAEPAVDPANGEWIAEAFEDRVKPEEEYADPQTDPTKS